MEEVGHQRRVLRIIDSLACSLGSLHFLSAPCEPAVARTPSATDSLGYHAFHGGAMLVNPEPEQAPPPLPNCCQLFCRIEKEANVLVGPHFKSVPGPRCG